MESDEIEYKVHDCSKHFYAASLEKLFRKDRRLVNRSYLGLTPFHIVANYFTAENLEPAFETIKVLVKYNADINSVAQIGDCSLHTPFSLLLDKLVGGSHQQGRVAKLLEFIIDSFYHIDIDHLGGGARDWFANVFPELFCRVATNFNADEFDANDKQQVLDKLKAYLDEEGEKFIRISARLAANERFAGVMKSLVEDCDLLRMAVNVGTQNCVKVLSLLAHLEGVFKETDPLLCTVAKELKEARPLESIGFYQCFDILMDAKKIDVNAKDSNGKTALHYAVRYNNEYVIEKLLEKGAYIGMINKFDALPIRFIDPDILERYFDSCITSNGSRLDDGLLELRFNYTCLMPPESQIKQLLPIQHMAESIDLQRLVQHPLITSFLCLKWFQSSPVFYTNLFFCSTLSISLVTYIVTRSHLGPFVAALLQILIAIGAIFMIAKKLFQLLMAPRIFWNSFINWLELSLIGCTGTILYKSISSNPSKTFLQESGSITIMLVAVELLILVSSLPIFTFSTHMVMLRTVLISFLRGLSLYSIVLVAFALAFYTLFSTRTLTSTDIDHNENCTRADKESNWFHNPGTALIKTLLMMTGDLDSGNIEFNRNPVIFGIFVGFVFVVVIVVMNLLNGLAVSDIQIIKSKAVLSNWLERLKILVTFESILLEMIKNKFRYYLRKRFPKWATIMLFSKSFPPHSIVFKPNEKVGYQIYRPVVTKDINGIRVGVECYPLETSSRLLNFLMKHFSVMDKRTIRQAVLVLEKKEREQKEASQKNALKTQINDMENMLREVLVKFTVKNKFKTF